MYCKTQYSRKYILSYLVVPTFALHCFVASAYGGIEGNIAHFRTRSCCETECGKNALRNVAKLPYMFRKCPKTLQESPIVAIMP